MTKEGAMLKELQDFVRAFQRIVDRYPELGHVRMARCACDECGLAFVSQQAMVDHYVRDHLLAVQAKAK